MTAFLPALPVQAVTLKNTYQNTAILYASHILELLARQRNYHAYFLSKIAFFQLFQPDNQSASDIFTKLFTFSGEYPSKTVKNIKNKPVLPLTQPD